MARRWQFPETTQVFQPPSIPVVPSFGWFVPWLQPVRFREQIPEGWLAWNPQVISVSVAPAPPFGWYELWLPPTRYPVRAAEGWLAWQPQFISIAATPSQLGFYQFWPNPTLARMPVQEGYFSWNTQVLVPPPVTPENYMASGVQNYVVQTIGEGKRFKP